jgi:hypothetical protein
MQCQYHLWTWYLRRLIDVSDIALYWPQSVVYGYKKFVVLPIVRDVRCGVKKWLTMQFHKYRCTHLPKPLGDFSLQEDRDKRVVRIKAWHMTLALGIIVWVGTIS